MKINQLKDWTTSAALDSMSQPHFALSANPGNYEKHTRTQDHPITHTHTHTVTYSGGGLLGSCQASGDSVLER